MSVSLRAKRTVLSSYIWFWLGLAALFLAPLPVRAVALGNLKVGIITGNNLIGVLGNLVDIALLWAGIIAFFYVLFGGFLYLTAGGDAGATDKARKTITNAIIGIVLITVSYVIVNYVISKTANGFADSGATTTTTNNGTTTNTGTNPLVTPASARLYTLSGRIQYSTTLKNNYHPASNEGIKVTLTPDSSNPNTQTYDTVTASDGAYGMSSSIPGGSYTLAVDGPVFDFDSAKRHACTTVTLNLTGATTAVSQSVTLTNLCNTAP